MSSTNFFLSIAAISAVYAGFTVFFAEQFIDADTKWLDKHFGPLEDNRDVAIRGNRLAISVSLCVSVFCAAVGSGL